MGAPERSKRACDPFDAGPYEGVYRALRLAPNSAGAPNWRRAVAFSAVGWLPLLLLAVVQGFLRGTDPRLSFLADVSAHVRYLLVIPLLVLSEAWCLPRLAAIARHFQSSGLVPPEEEPRLKEILESARRLLDHRGTEVALAGAAYLITIVVGARELGYGSKAWITGVETGPGSGLTWAGWWCVLFSQPLFLIVWFAWLWRAAVWMRFLRAVSRLDLELVASHPDLAGGLRFTADSLSAFSPVGFALGTVLSGSLAARLIVDGAAQGEDLKMLALGVAVALPICLFALPLLVFARPLRRARLRASREYGALALAVGHRFEGRWLRGHPRVTDDALSVPDFSATTDLYAIVSNIRHMSLTPIGLRDVVPLVVISLLPFAPLVLLVVPLSEVLKGLLGLFF